MLRRIKIDGYKGLRGTCLDLKQNGMTVLLGPNGSGKSSVFGAIQLLQEASARLLRECHIAGEHFADFVEHGDFLKNIGLEAEVMAETQRPTTWRLDLRQRSSALEVHQEELSDGIQQALRDSTGKLSVGGKSVNFSLANDQTLCKHVRSAKGFRDSSDNDVWRALAENVNESLGGCRTARLNPVRLSEAVPLGEQVDIDGYGLAAQLLQLSSTRRKLFAEIQDQFCGLFPWVEEIELPTASSRTTKQGKDILVGTSYVEIRFRERGVDNSYPAREMASGMLLALALLWMVHRPDGDRIICFDEPENSVHPYLLKYVYDLLKGVTRSESGRPPIQVLVATHSVDFVNLCEPDEVRICERTEAGGVQIQSIRDKKDLSQAVDNYRGAMGEMWLSGALGGFPTNALKSPRSR
jgi:predicted ATPase